MAQIETLAYHFSKARKVNETSNGYVSKVPTFTAPNGDAETATGSSVQTVAAGIGGTGENCMVICPYGAGANNTTFSVRVIGWRSCPDPSGLTKTLWIPMLLAEYACTISTTPVGLAGGYLTATDCFADTIVKTYPTDATPSSDTNSNAADLIACVVVDLKGSQRVELQFTTGGSATSANALIAMY